MKCAVWGGEEFAVFLRRADEDGAMAMAEKLREAVEAMVVNVDDALKISVTVSIGVATLSTRLRITSALALYKAADQAMYASKQAGRNRVTHYDSLIAESLTPATHIA